MASGYPAKRGGATATSPCGRCRKLILWATLAGSGKRAALDTNPDPSGEVYVLSKGGAWSVGFVVRDPGLQLELREQGYLLHRFHTDTCTNPHRRDRADLG